MIDIVGHKKITSFLKSSIKKNNLSHAYLFYGPSHIGKTTVAQNFINHLFCINNNACGTCLSCKQVIKYVHPDLCWISKSLDVNTKKIETIGINTVRKIKLILDLKPFSSDYKVAVIEHADNLTISAANSLLKILEEAPKKTIIILICNSLHRVPPTVLSRCQILRFSLPKQEQIKDFLQTKFYLKPEVIKQILQLCMNKPGLAVNFAKDSQKLKKQQAITDKFIDFLLKYDFEHRLKFINSIDLNVNSLNNLLMVVRFLILVKLEQVSASGELKILLNKYF